MSPPVRAFVLLVAMGIEGLWLSYRISTTLPDWPPAFLFLFAIQEPAAFAFILVVAIPLVGVRILRESVAGGAWNPVRVRLTIGSLACAAGGAALIGHYLVYRDHALAVDEFMTRFGEATLLRGDALARLPETWRPFAFPLQPIFTFLAPANGLWGNPYRPINAAGHALFAMIFGVDALANATLTAAAVVLAAAVTWRLWPTRDDAAVLAAILVATSPQVVITGMTLYAMPGHLALDLAWLLLFLRGGWLCHGLAAIVGFLAVGLHQINFHVLFVFPFLLFLLFSRRWKLVLFYGAVYAAAVIVWLNWFELALWWSGAAARPGPRDVGPSFLGGVRAAIALPDLLAFMTMATNLLRFVSWNNLALMPLVVVGLSGPRRHPVIRACGWGIVLTVIAFLLVLPSQGHGWGYRYLHGFIGSAVLIAVGGWIRLTEPGSSESGFARLAVQVLTVATLCLLVLRAVQVEAFVRPRAQALAVLRAQPAEVVVIDDGEVWYGQDLAQNDPYLRNSPKIMVLGALTWEQIALLCPRRPRLIGHAELALAGVYSPQWLWRQWPQYDEARKALRACAGPTTPSSTR